MSLKKDLVSVGFFTNQADAIGGGVETGITANAGSTQATGTALTQAVNVVATCATAGDALLLPAASKSDELWVRNNGAASADVFPQVGGTINNAAADAAFAVGASKTAIFKCIGGVDWIAVLTA